MTDIDKPVEREYDEKAPPEGLEASVNIVPEDSEESDLAKNQEPELDDEPLDDVEDDEPELTGTGEEGV